MQAAEPSEVVVIPFSGPFSWPGMPDAPSVFSTEIRRSTGIYLWTVPLQDGHLVYYVGETGRSFKERLFEHYKEHAAGMYHLHSPAEFARGHKVAVWPGRYDRTQRKSATECISQYLRLAPYIAELTYLYRFFLAPLTIEPRIRRRIEAAIAAALNAAPGLPGSFQDEGIRYAPRAKGESPIECVVAAPVRLLGLPERLSA